MTASIHRHALGLTWVEGDAMARAAHALVADGQVWLIDPFEDEIALSAAVELGRPAGVIQLLDRHNRDGNAIAQRLEIPRLRLPKTVPASPFVVVPVVDQRWWRELALWWPRERALVVAEAVGTAPLFALGRPLGVHPLLRLFPPRAQLGGHRPDRVFVGHGPALETDAAEALERALAAARSDIPKFATALPLLPLLPSLLRGGRG